MSKDKRHEIKKCSKLPDRQHKMLKRLAKLGTSEANLMCLKEWLIQGINASSVIELSIRYVHDSETFFTSILGALELLNKELAKDYAEGSKAREYASWIGHWAQEGKQMAKDFIIK